jgi:hypothetical protein
MCSHFSQAAIFSLSFFVVFLKKTMLSSCIGCPFGDLAATKAGIGCLSLSGERLGCRHNGIGCLPLPSGEGRLGCRVPEVITTLSGGDHFLNEFVSVPASALEFSDFASNCVGVGGVDGSGLGTFFGMNQMGEAGTLANFFKDPPESPNFDPEMSVLQAQSDLKAQACKPEVFEFRNFVGNDFAQLPFKRPSHYVCWEHDYDGGIPLDS